MTRAEHVASKVLTKRHLHPALGESPIVSLGWLLGTKSLSYEEGLNALVEEAASQEREHRTLIEVIAEELDRRGARAAAQLARDTDPDDDIRNNYLNPMLATLERDYTRMAEEMNS